MGKTTKKHVGVCRLHYTVRTYYMINILLQQFFESYTVAYWLPCRAMFDFQFKISCVKINITFGHILKKLAQRIDKLD